MLIYSSISRYSAVNETLSAVDGISCRSIDEFLSIEARQVDFLVGCDDDSVSSLNVFSGEHVLGSAGSLCLYLDADSLFTGSLFKRFGRHVCMRYACRASGDGDELFAIGSCGRSSCSSRRSLFCLVFCSLIFLSVDQCQEFLRCLGSDE